MAGEVEGPGSPNSQSVPCMQSSNTYGLRVSFSNQTERFSFRGVNNSLYPNESGNRDLNMITSNEDEQFLVYTCWLVRFSISFFLLSAFHVCPIEPQTAHSGAKVRLPLEQLANAVSAFYLFVCLFLISLPARQISS